MVKRSGRPRIAESTAVRQVICDLVNEGVRVFTLPLLVDALSTRLALSRATAYRALHRAHEEGVLRIPIFET